MRWRCKPLLQKRHGKCHREDTAGGAEPGDSPEENLRDVDEWYARR